MTKRQGRAAAVVMDWDALDTLPISELCRPLSAKVMPRSATLSLTGREMDGGILLESQRKEALSRWRRIQRQMGRRK